MGCLTAGFHATGKPCLHWARHPGRPQTLPSPRQGDRREPYAGPDSPLPSGMVSEQKLSCSEGPTSAVGRQRLETVASTKIFLAGEGGWIVKPTSF